MNIVSYLDNDEMNKPNTGAAPVYAAHDREPQKPVTKEQLLAKYPNVFADGVGKLDGEYHIRLDNTVDPVQHAPRQVP